jgi:hypothetical protein
MAQRAWKYFAIAAAGTPQPLVGTTMSAAISPSAGPLSIAVADSSIALQGDWVILDTPGTSEERCLVLSIPDGTHIQVSSVQFAHVSGAIVRSGIEVNSVFIQTLDGNAGFIYVGTSPVMVKATGAFLIAKLANVAGGQQPTYLASTRSGLANVDNIGQLWVDGSTGDKYLPSVGVMWGVRCHIWDKRFCLFYFSARWWFLDKQPLAVEGVVAAVVAAARFL